ncbi:MAG: hypothetical protein UR27_C0011G0015 [Candidatus Peregrinibacteria bacterium GW2011_GWA2_33_10]|nr:MAG: hypothetical protein UR27_C0011G0015 [Candidatus Peregrinibacteria bacterium GW2011_GWA2_33_10]KKP38877.1 MAG: acyl carrier protein [Candidatus Peregrinibacteria bacterium GW2011_GWC2_33_13]
MTNKQISEKLQKIFFELLEIKNLPPDLSMQNTPEWDSLKHLQLLTEIEKTFNIEIDFRDSLKMTSVKEIEELIKSKIS